MQSPETKPTSFLLFCLLWTLVGSSCCLGSSLAFIEYFDTEEVSFRLFILKDILLWPMYFSSDFRVNPNTFELYQLHPIQLFSYPSIEIYVTINSEINS